MTDWERLWLQFPDWLERASEYERRLLWLALELVNRGGNGPALAAVPLAQAMESRWSVASWVSSQRVNWVGWIARDDLVKVLGRIGGLTVDCAEAAVDLAVHSGWLMIERNYKRPRHPASPLPPESIAVVKASRSGIDLALAPRSWQAPPAPSPAPGATPPAATGKPAMSKKAKALAALADHPDWTDEQIAQAAGCHVKSLYRWKKFVRARELLREGRGDVVRGLKDGKTGNLEAWDDDESGNDDE